MAIHYDIDVSFEARDLAVIENGDPPVSAHDAGYGKMTSISITPDVDMRLGL
ncbi:MAG: hypothetical protein AAF988_08910 [Pseudomonadota bacterium]